MSAGLSIILKQARRQDSVTGGHKNFNTSNSRVWTKKNQGLHLKKCAHFHEFCDEDQKEKKRSSAQKMREFPRILG